MKTKPGFSVKECVYIALLAVLISVCSWIAVPFTVPFTMQTFAVFCVLLLLGGKRGTVSIGLYLFMGIIGLPVFSGFGGGIGHLIGPTGGYIIGFLFTGLVYILLEPLIEKRKGIRWAALTIGLAVCYLVGTLWFVWIFGTRGIDYSFFAALIKCVLPYIIPDFAKMVLAVLVCDRIDRFLPDRS